MQNFDSYSTEELHENLDISVRHGFVRKVFSIVGIQLLLTTLIALPFLSEPDEARAFMLQYPIFLGFVMLLPMILICYLACNQQAAREYPKNYFILGAITLCMGVSVGLTVSMYTAQSVLAVVGLTALIVCSLAIFAMQTKYDFTGMGPYIWAAFLILFGMSLLMMFFPASNTMQLAYAGLGSLLFSFWIVYDVQLIAGGKHKQGRFQIDDYVFAALTLYLDIINLFLMLLRLFGERRD